MWSGCPRACVQKGNGDKLVFGAGGIVIVGDDEGVVTSVEDLCPVLNSFSETQEAIKFVS